MRKNTVEIDLLDEWIFPEKKDPYIELSGKIVDILQKKVKKYNKLYSPNRTNIKQLKQAFVAGASGENLKDRELIESGFSRVKSFLNGKKLEFKKENFAIHQNGNSKEFEITYASPKDPCLEKENETEEHNLCDYQVNSIDELYLEDYKRNNIYY
jgi:hypothetical protein